MAIIYCLILMALAIIIFPFLFMKLVLNSFYIYLYNKREKYKGEHIVTLVMSVFIGPVLIGLSFLTDIVSLPNLIFKESSSFEHKYILL